MVCRGVLIVFCVSEGRVRRENLIGKRAGTSILHILNAISITALKAVEFNDVS
jgi:hypothetical protein